MLVVRAWLIVSGQAERKKEIAAVVVTLGVVGYFLVKMMMSMWSCRWPVLVVMVLLLVMSIVMSAFVEHTAARFMGPGKPGKVGEAKPGEARTAGEGAQGWIDTCHTGDRLPPPRLFVWEMGELLRHAQADGEVAHTGRQTSRKHPLLIRVLQALI